MDLDFTEEQTMLRDTVKTICQQHYDLGVVRAVENDELGYPEPFWQALVDSGIVAVAIPETFGGAGMGMMESVVLGEELGRHLAASPFLVSSVLAGKALAFADEQERAADWLAAIASGSVVISVAQLEQNGGYQQQGINASLSGGRLNATKILVPFANSVTHLLLLAKDADNGELVLCLVSREASGVSLQRQENIASSALFQVKVENCIVGENNLFRLGKAGWDIWQQAMSCAAVMAAAEAAGGAEKMLEITAEYAKTREQFGKPIGAFQALSHNMAELATDVEGCKKLVYEAAWACDSGRPWQLLAAQAKLQAGNCFRRTTAVGTQIHGGLGFTREGDPQLYFRRAKLQQLLFWDPDYLEQRIADLLLY